jgi:hypothetical protein
MTPGMKPCPGGCGHAMVPGSALCHACLGLVPPPILEDLAKLTDAGAQDHPTWSAASSIAIKWAQDGNRCREIKAARRGRRYRPRIP